MKDVLDHVWRIWWDLRDMVLLQRLALVVVFVVAAMFITWLLPTEDCVPVDYMTGRCNGY